MANEMERCELEFGGTLGVQALLFIMPFTTVYLNLACVENSCSIFAIPELPSIQNVLNLNSILVFLGWFMFQIILHVLPWGKLHYGLKLKNGKCLTYKCNGFMCFVISLILFIISAYFGLPISFIYSNFFPLLMASVIISFVLSLLLYIKSFIVTKDKLAEGLCGTFTYDFFMGRELNPRFMEVDLKFFIELRPGLIGWAILDICFLYESYERHGSLNHALLLVSLCHILYIADALWNEEAILSTMDITHEGLGFMLVFGNLSWVPFLYSLSARFLLEHPNTQWSLLAIGMFILINCIGYAIFRLSNSQKNNFRKNPMNPYFSRLKTLTTSSGKKLLISSWWGIVRHPNYLGDFIMSLTWSMITGFNHVIPYFYPIYFLSLLLHRAERDNKHCRKKYGSDWDQYCKLVPYKICPYIY